MNDNLNTAPESLNPGEGATRANPSGYLDRRSATILMIIKLAEGLSKLGLAILGAFMLQTVVNALNRIFHQGSSVADGKAMVAQVLKTLQVPAETIRQVVAEFPLDITFSSKPVLYVFVISLPFVLIAVLEAIAAIRLRLGKGGTRTIGILQRIYFVLHAIRLCVIVLVALILSIFTIFRLGGPLSIMLSTVYVSLAIFSLLVGLPILLYHRYIARTMDDIRYEMTTGLQAVRKQTRFQEVLLALIVLEVIGAIVSIAASWRPQQADVMTALLIVTMIGPVTKLVKFACVRSCYRNFMQEEGGQESDEAVSHVPQFVLIVLVILLFAIPNALICMQSSQFSTALVEKVEEFVSNARETVTEVSTKAETQIQTVQSVIANQMGKAGNAGAGHDEVKTEPVEAASPAKVQEKEEPAASGVSAEADEKEAGASLASKAE